MNELRALRRLRPEIQPPEDATFERIWGDITGTPGQGRDSSQQTETDIAPLFALEASPNSFVARRVLTGAAAVLVVMGVGAILGVSALLDHANQPAATVQLPADTASNAPRSSPSAISEELVLLLPGADVDPEFVQHDAALPHRSRGLVRAPDGSTLSINLYENHWGELPTDTEQREIGDAIWATTTNGTIRGYVTLDACNMVVLDAGPDGAVWDAHAVELMNAVQFKDSLTIDLPDGWQVIEIGTVGNWYSMSFDTSIEGVPGVQLTQMPGSSAGPLLADLAGRGISAITIDGNPAWQIPMEEAGWTQTVWQNDMGAMMLTSKDMTPERIDQFLTELTPASAADWDARYREKDVGRDMTMPVPPCGPLTLSVNNPGN
jgi:hypothetical protein